MMIHDMHMRRKRLRDIVEAKYIWNEFIVLSGQYIVFVGIKVAG